MVSRNHDSISFALSLTSGIIAVISLIFTCVGVGLPSWYVGTNANNTIIAAEANLFYSCFASNASQGTISTTFSCTAYSSYVCTTSSYQNTVLNVTASISGCINPTNGSSQYLNFNGPIYQVLIDDFYRIRSAAALSIISILFIFGSIIFSFLISILLLNIYFIFIGPILACLALIFGLCCLATAGAVFNNTGAGFALFFVGIILELIATVLLFIIAGRSLGMTKQGDNKEDEPIFSRRGNSPIIVRRVLKRRI
jgi:hypothetical protein